jgi:hypothetical protein
LTSSVSSGATELQSDRFLAQRAHYCLKHDWKNSTTEKRMKRSVLLSLCVGFISIGLPQHSRGDTLTDWNTHATTLAAAAGLNPLAQSRLFAMMHVATHDALNSIESRYEAYFYEGSVPGASPEAAVASAAHAVLLANLPAQQWALDTAYAISLAAIPEGPAKQAGIEVGHAVALAILQLRSNDGSSDPMLYTPGTEPGDWRPTPPLYLPAFLPGWGQVTCFAVRSGEQFRPDPPEVFDLTSEKYAREFNEVKSIGDANSTTRTDEQSEIARFWYEPSQAGWNRIGRVVSAQYGLDLWENARLFALLNLALADGYIVGFNIKYHYNFWRPVTAIQAADTDGNPRTIPDPLWLPYLITPMSPDFPSTHSVLGAAAAKVLENYFGTDFISFSMTSGAPFPGITRAFVSFSHAAQENADSRVYAGIHFRSACIHGLRVGERIGAFTFKHHLRTIAQHHPRTPRRP